MAFNATLVTSGAFTITPSDTTPISAYGVYVGGTGDLTVTPMNGAADVVFKAVPVGTIIPLAIAKVKAATTATLLIGFGPT